MKRILPLFLVVMMYLIVLPVSALAEENDDKFTITIVVNGRRDSVVDGESIPSSGDYNNNYEITLPALDDECFCGWYEGNDDIGHVYTVTHAATLTAVFDHEFSEWSDSRPASCVIDGERKRVCEKCHYEQTELVSKVGHDYQFVDAQEASCSEEGNIDYYYCPVCKQYFNLDKTVVLDVDDIKVPKTDHSWNTNLENIDAKYLKTNANCTRGAEYYRYCTSCGISADDVDDPPEPETLQDDKTLDHHIIQVEGVAATCTTAGNISCYKCSVCDKYFENEDRTNELTAEQIVIPAKSTDGTHLWDESGQCTRCSAKAFRLTATYNNLGTVKVNGTDATSGTPVFLMPGEAVTVTFTPNENMFLNEVTVGGNVTAVTDNSLTIPEAEALGDTSKTIAVTFSNHITGADVTVKFADASEAKNTQAGAYRSTLATGTVTPDDIKVIAKEAIPVWADAEGDPTDAELTPDEIEDAVPLSFKMPYPEGINDTNRGNYRYYVFHLGETPAACSISDIRADGLATSSSAFSTFASFAVPKAAQAAPAINVRHRLNNGTLRTGALLNVSNLMEYRVGDSTTYLPITGSGSTWVGDASTGLAAGTYHVRYKGTGEKLPSPETTIQIDDYYTVPVQKESGTGEWLAVSGTVSTYNGAYEVKKGNTLGLTFTAGDGYVVDLITDGTKITTPRTKTADYLVTNITSSRTVKVSFRTPSSTPAIDYTVSPEPIEVLPVVDDGTTQKGHIYFRTDGRQIEYIKSATEPTNSSKWIKLDGTKLSNLAAGGNYWYKYVGQDASQALVTPLLDLYTVTIEKKGSGKGTYVVDGYEKDPDNIYLVEKGEEITVKFIPDNHYWLYKITVNGERVYYGSANVETEMTFKDIREPKKITYSFTDSSSSPKTGDRSDVNLWIAEEILSFLGMTTITWYLFRRKETY